MKRLFEKTPWRPFYAPPTTISGGWHVVDCDGSRLFNYVGSEEMAKAICLLPGFMANRPKLDSEQYRSELGSRCPNCLSKQIEGWGANVDGATVSQKILCTACEAMWTEVYTLSGYTDLEANDES